ncbi:MAG: TIGR04255 family protein [Candidatus Odinarchaeota archaeon]
MEIPNHIIYPRPTVSQVIFQIRYSNMFMIEDRIGEYQSLIIDKFPESSLTMKKQLLIANYVDKIDLETIPVDEQFARKIWNFKSEKDYVLGVSTSSLDINSQHHKSYQSTDNIEGFREIIKFAVDKFLDIMPIKTFKRIGLRYIDDCPIPSKETGRFKEWYNTVLPLERFELGQLRSMLFETKKVRKNEYFLNYRENFVPVDSNGKEYKFYLDFDSFKENFPSLKYLDILDELHKIIHQEWENTIKTPVKRWMNEEIEV